MAVTRIAINGFGRIGRSAFKIARERKDIEIVEQWDVEKTMKYLSRAEWTLHNLRGIPLKDAGVRQDNYENEEIQYNKTQQKESKTKKQTNKERGIIL